MEEERYEAVELGVVALLSRVEAAVAARLGPDAFTYKKDTRREETIIGERKGGNAPLRVGTVPGTQVQLKKQRGLN